LVLIAGTDFETTRELSVAFALLIFLSVLIVAPSASDPNKVLGAKVFQKFADMINTPAKPPAPNNPSET
jgi:hypothetical protein